MHPVAHDQGRPPFADRFQAAGDRTRHAGEALVLHAHKMALSLSLCKSLGGQADRERARRRNYAVADKGDLRRPAQSAAGRLGYFASASAPALATCASCEGSAPETPMAPIILPSIM